MKRVVQFFFVTFVVLFSLSCEDPMEYANGLIDDLAVEGVEFGDTNSSGGFEPVEGSLRGKPRYKVYVKVEALMSNYDYRGVAIWPPRTSEGRHPDAGKRVLARAKVYESTYYSNGPDTTYNRKKAWRFYTTDSRAGYWGTPNGRLKLSIKVIDRLTGRRVLNSSEITRRGAFVYFDTLAKK